MGNELHAADINAVARAVGDCLGWSTPEGHDFLGDKNPRAQEWVRIATGAILAMEKQGWRRPPASPAPGRDVADV